MGENPFENSLNVFFPWVAMRVSGWFFSDPIYIFVIFDNWVYNMAAVNQVVKQKESVSVF